MKAMISWTTAITLTLAALAYAGVPRTINYQGYITNNGTPVNNVATNVTFSLYSSNPARNNPAWSDTHSVTPVNGIYSVQLGSQKALNAPFDVPYWLGVSVAGTTLPLQPLSSAPYALRAAGVDVGTQTIQTGDAANTGLIVKGANGQTADLQQWQDTSGASVAAMSPTGDLTITGNLNLPATTATTGIIKSGSNTLLHSYGTGNIFVGRSAGNFTTSGTGNSALGSGALQNNTTGTMNTAVGQAALGMNNTGSNNTAIGMWAGQSGLFSQANRDGNNNTFIGYNASFYNANPVGTPVSYSNATAIGANAQVGQDNSLVLGGLGANAVKVGIGTAVPAATLDVVGDVKVSGTLTVDGSGLTNLWKTTGNTGTVAGTNFIGTTDNIPVEIRSNNKSVMRLSSPSHEYAGAAVTVTDVPNIIGGFSQNSVSNGVVGATISGGGGYSEGGLFTLYSAPNTVTGMNGTVAGGGSNTAGFRASVGGGWGNTASGLNSTVSGGAGNIANGGSSTVSGGSNNKAGGDNSWAGGNQAIVRDAATVGNGSTTGDQGTFVWADSQNASFTSTGQNQFLVRALGGVGINTNSPGFTLDVNGTGRVTTNFDLAAAGAQIGFNRNSTNGVIYNNTHNAWQIGPTGTNDPFVISAWRGADGVPLSNPLVLTTDGKVGIGTSTPNRPLHIAGAASAEMNLGVTGGATDWKTWNLLVDGGGGNRQNLTFRILNDAGTGESLHAFVLWNDGHATLAGNMIANGVTLTSDRRLKTDIQPLENSLAKVLRLRGVSYVMKADETRSRKIGVIAQELEQEYPELVASDDKGMKSVAYANLTAVLIEAVKGLKAENDALKADNDAMKLRLERLEKALFGR